MIPDVVDAIASPVGVTDDLVVARRILELLPSIPTPVWGRDELAHRRDVELELRHLMGAHARRSRHLAAPTADRRSRARLGRGPGCRGA